MFLSPLWGLVRHALYPQLAPLRQAQGKLWAAFFRRSTAGVRDSGGVGCWRSDTRMKKFRAW